MLVKGHNIQGVIFDLDGTLLDSCSIWVQVDIEFFAKRGMTVPNDYSKAIAHLGLDNAAVYTKKRFNLEESKEDILNEWKSLSVHHYESDIELKNHAKELIQHLLDNGVKLAVATANDPECYEPCLKRHGLYDCFEFIEDVRQFPGGKKTPDIYLSVAKRLGVEPSHCLVLEDIVVALQSAKLGNFITCAVYESTCKEEKTKKEISDIYIKDFKELI